MINPGAILGPLLDDDPGTSGALIQRLLDGSLPAAPRISFSIVDVRDVAAAHLAAMTNPEAGGQRIILSDSEMSIMALANVLRAALPAYRQEAPAASNCRIGSSASPACSIAQIRGNTGELGNVRRVDGNPGRALLGRPTITASDAALATAQSLIAHRLVKP